MKESKHALFCKKARQKTFALDPGILKRPGTQRSKSFLLLFFKKVALS
jgi:hypothetical protein